MSYSAVFEARSDGETTLDRFVADTNIILRLAEDVASHPGKPRNLTLGWYEADERLRSAESVLESLRWLQRFLKGEVSLVSGARPPYGSRPLHEAAAAGDLDAVREHLQDTEDIDRPSGRQTALMWAVLNNHVEVVRTLLKAGASVDARGTHTSLSEALPDTPKPLKLDDYLSAEGDLEGAIQLCQRAAGDKAKVLVTLI